MILAQVLRITYYFAKYHRLLIWLLILIMSFSIYD